MRLWRLAFLSMPIFLLRAAGCLGGLAAVRGSRTAGRCHWARRGHARAAPENTLSAIRKAIESGADYAEVDAQMTRPTAC